MLAGRIPTIDTIKTADLSQRQYLARRLAESNPLRNQLQPLRGTDPGIWRERSGKFNRITEQCEMTTGIWFTPAFEAEFMAKAP